MRNVRKKRTYYTYSKRWNNELTGGIRRRMGHTMGNKIVVIVDSLYLAKFSQQSNFEIFFNLLYNIYRERERSKYSM